MKPGFKLLLTLIYLAAVFWVNGQNPDSMIEGVHAPSEGSLIQKPSLGWWNTKWAKVAYVLIFLSGLYVLHCFLLRRRLAKEQINHFKELHDLKASFNENNGRLTAMKDGQSEKTVLSPDEYFLQKTRQLVEKNLNNEYFGIHELRIGLRISRAQLHRKLKTLTGHSTTHYIWSIRLQKAKDLLSHEEELNISEIAYRVGFRSPVYFSQVFTEEFGRSPSDFRKKPKDY